MTYLFINNHFIIILLIFIQSSKTFRPRYIIKAKPCPHPAVPLNAQVNLSDEIHLQPGSTATYTCDDGYELFGPAQRICIDGSWSDELPFCAVDVAYRKPSSQSSTVKGGESSKANDYDRNTVPDKRYCTETKSETSPWWQVDLLKPYEVKVVRIVNKGCCTRNLHDIEIRVGNGTTVQKNRLCAWLPSVLPSGTVKDFYCANPITGRYVYIQMVGVDASLSLCGVFVFTTDEFAEDRCDTQMDHQKLICFNQTCYEFHSEKGGSFFDAENYCHARGGLVVNTVTDVTHKFLYHQLEGLKHTIKSTLVWLGARRSSDAPSNFTSLIRESANRASNKFWVWVTGKPIHTFRWSSDQPNNYNGRQDCIALDGGRKWLWNDVTCDLNYVPWICQYNPSNCGSPDKNENSTVIGDDFRVGREIHYKCPIGHKIVGSHTRKCESTGFWTDSAPTCKYINCGPLPDIEHGRVYLVNQSRTTYNATAKYICDKDYTIVGNESRICLGNGSWSYSEPKCLYSWCPELPSIPQGIISMTNRTENGILTYKCQRGHKLIGNDTRRCLLGGNWTGDEPVCKYINCGKPSDIRFGSYELINGTTTYQSQIKYECEANYMLSGLETRYCTEFGKWSGVEPICKLINCGKPDISNGVDATGDKYTVNSIIKYKCKPGHKLINGDNEIKCNSQGKWEGTIPNCRFIDCGRVQTIFKGEAKYLNTTTHLGSMISYSCSSGYKLTGSSLRECADDGRWTGTTPKCEEIRCYPPEKPKNSSVVYSGNDRSTSESFKIGSTVQYRCSTGYVTIGVSLRTCKSNGKWSDDVPKCVFVDCGFPDHLPNGRWLLTSNTTHYGSYVEYECLANYKLEGPQKRMCFENGTWSDFTPSCQNINCGKPPVKDSKTRVSGATSYNVGDKVQYSCVSGYELVGAGERICASDGLWTNDVPYCRIVECGKPPIIPNGRGFLLNGTTTFESVVEYQCIQDYKLIGETKRKCLSSGLWSGTLPRCLERIAVNEFIHNDIEDPDGAASSTNSQLMQSSKAIGIGISIAICALLVLIITIAIVCFKTKKPKPVKNSDNLGITRPTDKANATVMSYSRLSLESEAASNNLPNSGPIRHHPNGLVTFSAPSQTTPIYANINGFRGNNGNIVSVNVRPANSKARLVEVTSINGNNGSDNPTLEVNVRPTNSNTRLVGIKTASEKINGSDSSTLEV